MTRLVSNHKSSIQCIATFQARGGVPWEQVRIKDGGLCDMIRAWTGLGKDAKQSEFLLVGNRVAWKFLMCGVVLCGYDPSDLTIIDGSR